jgi:hypothetical protein
MDKLSWTITQSGDISIVANWVPNDGEIALTDIIPSRTSALIGYLKAPTSAAAAYRFEFEYGIEYVPNEAYIAYTNTKDPEIIPVAWYYINKELNAHWDRWLLMPYQVYLDEIKLYDISNPGHTAITRLTAMGSYGNGNNLADADIVDQVIEEAESYEEINPFENNHKTTADRLIRATKNALKDTACHMYPTASFCSPKGETFSEIRADMVGPTMLPLHGRNH